MAAPIPEEKCHVFLHITFFGDVKNATGYHSGLTTPTLADGASLLTAQVLPSLGKQMSEAIFDVFFS